MTSSICDGGTGRDGLEMGGPDVPCAQAPRVLWGHTQPTWQAGLNTTVTLFRNLRLYGRVDGNGGHVHFAATANDATDFAETQPEPDASETLMYVYATPEEKAQWR